MFTIKIEDGRKALLIPSDIEMKLFLSEIAVFDLKKNTLLQNLVFLVRHFVKKALNKNNFKGPGRWGLRWGLQKLIFGLC